jgi:hypothetical protein
VQHDLSYLPPISAIGIRIKQPQIGNQMNQIILRYPWFGGATPSTSGSSSTPCIGHPSVERRRSVSVSWHFLKATDVAGPAAPRPSRPSP